MRLQRSSLGGGEQCVETAPRPDAAITKSAGAGASSAPSQRPHPVARVADAEACALCGACVDACVRGAISLDETVVVDTRLCTGCGACLDVCPLDVLELVEA